MSVKYWFCFTYNPYICTTKFKGTQYSIVVALCHVDFFLSFFLWMRCLVKRDKNKDYSKNGLDPKHKIKCLLEDLCVSITVSPGIHVN